MLIEFWERLRGYQGWNETNAVIESAIVNKEPVGERGILFITTSVDTLAWNDQTGQKHSAELKLPDDSPLFHLKAGDAVTIRYNPARPDEFYLRDLLRTRVHGFFLKGVAGICVALIVIFYIVHAMARIYLRHHTRRLW
jgi:hypothetical protein